MSKHVFVINSLRKPKKIEFICSDNKNRSMLVKCGEDLRTDARIMTIFNMINTQMKNTDLETYNVFPIKNDIGLIEWIDNSISMKGLIERDCLGESIHKHISIQRKKEYLGKIGTDNYRNHLELYKLPDNEIVF